MNKYIDADRLRAKIEQWYNTYKIGQHGAFRGGKVEALRETIELIDSLQREHPKVDLVAELKHHLATTPKEQLEKEWKELEPWGNIGPTVQEFLYGKQPDNSSKEKALSLQIQAYLTTASDELYAPGKPLYTKEHHEGIHKCMKMWQKLHQYYFSTKQEQSEMDLEKEIDNFLNETGAPYLWCNDDEQKDWCSVIAHHFAKWGATHLNARKEE